MFQRKIYVIVFCLALVATVFPQTKTGANKSPEISDALKAKANGLLLVLAREADQFFLPENRIFARTQVANLLWESDEKQARQLFQTAVGELETLIGALVVDDSPDDEKYFRIYDAGELRKVLLFQIARHDPAYALSAFRSLSPKKPTGEDFFEGDVNFELDLAEKIAQSDPKKAFELSISQLEKSYPYGMMATLEKIYDQDDEIGAKLAQAVFDRIKKQISGAASKKTSAGNSNTAAKPLATPQVSPETEEISFWQIKEFTEKVKTLNRKSLRDNKTVLLAENDYKELVGILAKEFSKQTYLSVYEVRGFMKEIDLYFPVSAQTIRRRLATEKAGLDKSIREYSFEVEIEGKTTKEIIEIIEKRPVGQREELYQKGAEILIAEGDVIAANELHSKVKTKPEYDYVAEQIKMELPKALAEEGNLDEVRQILATVKTPEEKIEILTTLAHSLSAKGNLKSARELTEEARAMFLGKMKTRTNLVSVMQLSGAFALLEPQQSFAFLETNISLINDIIAAGIVVDEFNGLGSIRDDEVLLNVVQTESFRNMPKGVALLRNLSNADFERTVGVADRFARREAKFFGRFRIVQALLDPNAEEIEAANQISYEGEGC